MDEPIKLYMITGFLGSGKTTFLRRLLLEAENERVGVIVNEFGSIGVDGKLISSGTVDLVEINNGSIFCSCLKDNFIRALKALSEQPIHSLIIENSGLADPAGMQGILNGLSLYLTRQYEYQGSICLIDCTNFMENYDVLLPVQNQIAVADVILVNKADLAENNTLEAIHAVLLNANPQAAVLDTQYADVSISWLRSTIKARATGKIGTAPTFLRPYTCTVVCSMPQSSQAVNCFLAAMSPFAARIKGFVWDTEGNLMYADASGISRSVILVDMSYDEPFGALVVIGRNTNDIRANINTAWQDCCRGEITLHRTSICKK